MLEEAEAGRLEFHLEPDCLWIDRYELWPDFRGKKYGIQPMGQAVQYARDHGRPCIRMALPPELGGFFAKYGMVPRENGVWELDIRLILRDIP